MSSDNQEYERLKLSEEHINNHKLVCNDDYIIQELNSDETSNFLHNSSEPIDFVLVFDADEDFIDRKDKFDSDGKHEREHDRLEKRKEYRDIFEKNLTNEGLILERTVNNGLCFVKIHVTQEVLCRYSEIMKIRLPMKVVSDDDEEADFTGGKVKPKNKFKKYINIEYFTKNQYELTAEFSRSKPYLFDVDNPSFFPQNVRTGVVGFILDRTSFSKNPEKDDAVFDFGVERMLAQGAYKTAYPLHEGSYPKIGTKRALLISRWAQMKNLMYYQPIDMIKDYFGIKFALYFAWFGFYNYMLIPASIFGVILFVIGVISIQGNTHSNDICDQSLNITMCPQCNYLCDYWKLHESCKQARLTYLFDNTYTVTFAVFMSLWGSIYLELWKRHTAEITHKWGLTGFDLEAEHPRPQYMAKFKDAKPKLNVVTQQQEPSVPFWTVKVPFMILSYSIVLFLVALAFGAVFGVIIYRMSLAKSQSLFGMKDNVIYKDVVIPTSAAVLNLIIITILNYIYSKIAYYLTEMEMLRTQTEVDDSLTLKIYLFQFVNYYSSLFYIAFFKGKIVGHPSKYITILGIRQEECSPGGCFHEVFIQLAIIMVGRKVLSYTIEILKNLFKMVKSRMYDQGKSEEIYENQWTEDYKLQPFPETGLFNDYLEIVLQYGFVTIFVAAFPLAPFFALLINSIELRRDAKKFLKRHRKPIPQRARNIGVWYQIMGILGRLSVVTNACIIAFTSNFIPRIVYMKVVNKNHTDVGFMQHSLSFFDTKDFELGSPPNSSFGDVAVCRYREYRNPPWDANIPKYELSQIFWHILVARLSFVVVYQNIVSIVRLIVQWAIPDMSRKLNDQIKREAYLTTNIIIENEALLSKNKSHTPE